MRTPAKGARGAQPTWAWSVVAVAAVAGLVLRILINTSSLGALDADEAVWGLMSRHVLEGDVSAFYWGQGYGGTLEVLLGVPFVAMSSSVWAIRVIPVVLTAVAAVLVWRVGRRTIGEPAATVAGAIFLVWPAYLVWKSTRAHGFYSSGLVLGTLVLLLVLRLAERRSRRDTALLGLTLGLGAWQTPQIAPIVVPALAWLTFRRRSAWRDAWVAVPLVLVGVLPSIVSNVRHDWWSFRLDSGDTPYVPRVRGFLSATIPMTLGIRVPFTSEWLVGAGVSAALYAALVGALVVAAWRLRHSNMLLLVAVVAAYPFLAALSPSTWITDEPRYVMMAVPALVLLLASPLTSPVRAWVGLSFALALTTVTLLEIPGPQYEQRADGQFVPHELGPLVTELDRRGISAVFTDYWVAYPLLFRTNERIVAAEADLATLAVRGGRVAPKVPKRASDIRWRPYDDLVRGAPEPGWVLLATSDAERRWRPLLEREGYVRTQVGGFAVYGRAGRVAGSAAMHGRASRARAELVTRHGRPKDAGAATRDPHPEVNNT